ncbi:MAG: SWIM zinc finger family protein, partial [bacterium]|nr:SWIM zinc finger family protein [bacterium]
MSNNREKTDLYKKLTRNDLTEWAGSAVVSRGSNYVRRVQDLACTEDGDPVALVQGGSLYATRVTYDGSKLTSECTCPYWGTCKHAVAVVLKYLEFLKQSIEIPVVSDDDNRMAMLAGTDGDTETDDDEDEWGDEWNEEDDAEEDDEVPAAEGKNDVRPSGKGSVTLRAFLNQHTKEELIVLIQELAESHSGVERFLKDRRSLATGEVQGMVDAVRRDIIRLSSEPAWSNHWNDEGYIPDYSPVRDRLEVILDGGHADAVITLGGLLMERGINQVESSQDDGELGEEIASCLRVVFRAFPASSLAPAEQILQTLELVLRDNYDLCRDADIVLEQELSRSEWSLAADKLWENLNNLQPADENGFIRDYSRDRLSDWLIKALEKAGRQEDVLQLCRQEARITGSYDRLVKQLRQAGLRDEAEQWIHKGIEATGKDSPGIAAGLRTALRELREEAGDYLSAAAFLAEDFFDSPGLRSYLELKQASESAGVWQTVRPVVLRYLETGAMPDMAAPEWPLPGTGIKEGPKKQRTTDYPAADVLIEIAIAEKQPDEVLRWYDQRQPRFTYWGYDNMDDKVAQAVAGAAPERAVAIWKKLAEELIAQTKVGAYETAAGYLRKVRRVLDDQGRENEWQVYLAALRRDNARKRRLLEILSGLENVPIIEEM